MRLSNATLPHLLPEIARPTYDRAALRTGIVHLGIGAFHRAHQAVCTEAALRAGDLRWGITGVSLRSPATRDALAPQDNLYAMNVRGETETTGIVGSITGTLVAPQDPEAVIAALAAPDTRIVSLTITEKGYGLDSATGALDATDPAIAHDLANPRAPRTALGFLAAAIARRREHGLPPFTVLSCDNLAANGPTLHRLLVDHATRLDPELGAYVAHHIACPATMVDRIVPATTDADRARVAAALGLHDAWPVVAEPFLQWVIEDRFTAGRPEWDLHGATFAADVAPFEDMKLRLLNGAHSALVYLGLAAGHETVAQAVADPALSAFALALMQDAAATLDMPAGIDVPAYQQALLARFANPALQHRLKQIAMDGSQKLPPRLLAPLRLRLAQGLEAPHHATAIAAWIHHAATTPDLQDPLAPEIARTLRTNGPEALLDLKQIFATPTRQERQIILQALSRLRYTAG